MGRIKSIVMIISIVATLSMVFAVENSTGENKSRDWEKIDISGKVENVYMAPSPKNPEVTHFCVRLTTTDGKTYEVHFGKKELPIGVGDEINVRGGYAPQFGDIVKAMYVCDTTTGFEWHRGKNKKMDSGGESGSGSSGSSGGGYKSGSK
jgi:uncharacterized membrane protein YgcG